MRPEDGAEPLTVPPPPHIPPLLNPGSPSQPSLTLLGALRTTLPEPGSAHGGDELFLHFLFLEETVYVGVGTAEG